MRCKSVIQVIFGGVEGKIPNKQFCVHVIYCPDYPIILQTVP
ncbi:MAG: hypothetical protein JWN25_2225 [Verrucomicrobiales bacterium]|nr:hypothetical protein [Verrucomicrobiales bacterium]